MKKALTALAVFLAVAGSGFAEEQKAGFQEFYLGMSKSEIKSIVDNSKDYRNIFLSKKEAFYGPKKWETSPLFYGKGHFFPEARSKNSYNTITEINNEEYKIIFLFNDEEILIEIMIDSAWYTSEYISSLETALDYFIKAFIEKYGNSKYKPKFEKSDRIGQSGYYNNFSLYEWKDKNVTRTISGNGLSAEELGFSIRISDDIKVAEYVKKSEAKKKDNIKDMLK